MKEKVLSVKEIFIKRANVIILLAAFLIPAVFLTAVYAALDFYPFGDKSVLVMDMADQYCEFFASLRYAFNGDNSLLFSWSRSMGGNFIGLTAYYIASPLSFITVFFSLENLPVALLLLTILKTGLSGLSFAVYLQYGFNHGKGKYKNIVFACCYALMSYAMLYNMCLMWMDGLILLPLILLGTEQLIKGKKGLLFFLALTASFICNYYTAYMIGIFTAIYLLYRVWCLFDKTQVKKVLVIFAKFAANTVLALLLAAPLLLPTINDLLTGRLTFEAVAEQGNYYVWLLTDSLFGGYSGIINDGRPSIFCGTLMLVLGILFFFMKKIHWKEKIGAGLIFLLFILSFCLVDLNTAWHGFVVPNWFPYRYAFLCSAFLLITAYRATEVFVFSENTKKRMPVSFAVYLAAMLLMFTGVELYTNASANIKGLDGQFVYKKIEDYRAFLKKMEPLVETVQKKDSSFYRMANDSNTEFSKNDAMLLGYNGMTHYSSTFHNGVNVFTKQLGIAQAHIWNSGYGATPVMDSIFGVKYRMMITDMPETYKDTGIENEGVKVYEDTNVLPIAFASGKIDTIEFSGSNNFKNQNQLLNLLAQTDDVDYFKGIEHASDYSGVGADYTWTAKNENPVYIIIEGIGNALAEVKANGRFMGYQLSSETNCDLFVGQFKEGEDVKVSCYGTNAIPQNELVYELDLKAYEQAFQKLNKGALKITKQKGSTIEGTIEVLEDQMIFTSIPYDKGFSVTVDGKEVKTASLKTQKDGKKTDVFLTVPAEAGKHEIKISYTPPGFMLGIVLAIAAIAAAFGYYGFSWLKGKINRKNVETKK